MAIVYDFKIWIAVKLGEILKRNIAPSEITLGAVVASGGTKASLVPVTYKGGVYQIAYDRYPIESLVTKEVLQKKGVSFSATTTAADIVAGVAKLGIILTPSDIDMSTVVNDKGIYTVQLSSACYGYKGAIVAYSSDTEYIPIPLHYWPLKGDTKNYGSSAGADWAPPVTFSDGIGGVMAQRTEAALAAIGTPLPVTEDFSICIEMVADSLAMQGMFTPASTLQYATSMLLINGVLGTYLSTSYANAWSTPDGNLYPKVGAKAMMMHTRKGRRLCVYVNGILVTSGDATLPEMGIMTHFGLYNGGYPWGTGMRFANISYYDVALTAEQVLKHANNVYGNRQ